MFVHLSITAWLLLLCSWLCNGAPLPHDCPTYQPTKCYYCKPGENASRSDCLFNTEELMLPSWNQFTMCTAHGFPADKYNEFLASLGR